MTTKVATNGLSPARPPFRRQGSSVQGGHPLAVVLASSPQVDYSVTKGGARTWIVLLVFGLLCTSIYTLFSGEAGNGLHLDLDDDDDSDHISERLRMRAAEEEEDEEEDPPARKERRREPPARVKQKIEPEEEEEPVAPAADDSSEEDGGGADIEESMLANLRRKMEQKLKEMMTQEEEAEPPAPKRAKKHRPTKKNEEAEEEKEDEESKPASRRSGKKLKAAEHEEDEEEAEEVHEERKRPHGRRQRKQASVKEEEEDEEEEEEKKEEEESKTEEKSEPEEEEEAAAVEEEEEKEEEKKPRKGNKVEIPSADEEGEAEADEEQETRQKKRKRKSALSSAPDTGPSRPCTRKHCPPEYAALPRKNLLIKKKNLHEAIEDEEEEEEGDEEEEEMEKEEKRREEETPPPPVVEPVAEVIALRKYKASGREAYKRHAITNRDDHRIRAELDQADRLLDAHSLRSAFSTLRALLSSHPHSPRVLFSLARAHDIRAEEDDDEAAVDEAIQYYQRVVEEDSTPDLLFRQAATRLADRARFRSQLHTTLAAQRALIDRFPDDLRLQTDMALSFLAMGRLQDARKLLNNVLSVDVSDGYALAYRGLVHKLEGDIEGGVNEMRKGLRLLASTGDDLADARLFHHLGDGLMQLGRRAEAYSVYEQGAALGLFLSAFQRSTHNVEGIRAQPWWGIEQSGYAKQLKSVERQWVSIRHEAVHLLESDPHSFRPIHTPGVKKEDEHLAEYLLFQDSARHKTNCKATPLTCNILDNFAKSTNAVKSEMSLVFLRAGTRLPPHCGASNTRLVAELGLIVPSEARIRVGHETRGWKLGHFIIYDDSFEHEVWMEGAAASAYRLALSIDLWHPDVPMHLRTGDEDEDDED